MDTTFSETAKTTQFLMVVNSPGEEQQARLLIESLRAFGGPLQDSSVWVFTLGTAPLKALAGVGNTACFPLSIEAPFRQYELADKVFACAKAEELAGPAVGSLVWLNLDCLIINPPILFDLAPPYAAALRPVHLRNVGSPAQAPLDDYWQTIYRAVGVERATYTVESFVDAQCLRPYFNTHCFSINPALGLLQAWREQFKALVTDGAFQAGPCRDELHQVFLHQAVLSGLIMKALAPARLRMLPPDYSYPLHLQPQIPAARRVHCLNQLVCAVYEEMDPADEVEIQEPLKSWLALHQNQASGASSPSA